MGQEPNSWNKTSLALSIPMLLVSGPLVGYWLGRLVRHWTGWGEWADWLFVILGMVAGVKESVRIIRRLS